MMIDYRFTMSGSAARGQAWEVTGQVSVPQEGMFEQACSDARRMAFMKLTRGEAVYGKPGVGCKGPYRIVKFSINRVIYDDVDPAD